MCRNDIYHHNKAWLIMTYSSSIIICLFCRYLEMFILFQFPTYLCCNVTDDNTHWPSLLFLCHTQYFLLNYWTFVSITVFPSFLFRLKAHLIKPSSLGENKSSLASWITLHLQPKTSQTSMSAKSRNSNPLPSSMHGADHSVLTFPISFLSSNNNLEEPVIMALLFLSLSVFLLRICSL